MSGDSKRSSIFSRRRVSRTPAADADADAANAPPPAYNAMPDQAPPGIDSPHGGIPAAPANPEPVDLTAAFANLHLANLPGDPTVETALAHLKLLFAIQWMKEDVGFTDGLWGLWDARAGPVDPLVKGRPEKPAAKGAEGEKSEKGAWQPDPKDKLRDKNLENLSKIREKRWALFVARAASRYETWWKTLERVTTARPMTTGAMSVNDSEVYSHFPTRTAESFWVSEDMLPPLGE